MGHACGLLANRRRTCSSAVDMESGTPSPVHGTIVQDVKSTPTPTTCRLEEAPLLDVAAVASATAAATTLEAPSSQSPGCWRAKLGVGSVSASFSKALVIREGYIYIYRGEKDERRRKVNVCDSKLHWGSNTCAPHTVLYMHAACCCVSQHCSRRHQHVPSGLDGVIWPCLYRSVDVPSSEPSSTFTCHCAYTRARARAPRPRPKPRHVRWPMVSLVQCTLLAAVEKKERRETRSATYNNSTH